MASRIQYYYCLSQTETHDHHHTFSCRPRCSLQNDKVTPKKPGGFITQR